MFEGVQRAAVVLCVLCRHLALCYHHSTPHSSDRSGKTLVLYVCTCDPFGENLPKRAETIIEI